jgi:hypothetical protein
MRLRSIVPRMLPLLLLAACNGEEPSAAAPASPESPPPAAVDQPAEDIPPATAPEPVAGIHQARFDGYAAMRFGMDEAAARAAWEGGLNGEASDNCHYLNPNGAHPPSYLAFMFDGGAFVRYDVGNDDIEAPGGGKRGMDAADIEALYAGRVQASPHKYTGGQYLRIEDVNGEGVLVFETDASGKVTEWHAGLPPQVDYVEGCS